MKQNFQEFIKNCDQLIASGQAAEVKNHFRELSYKSIPREFRQPLAEIARRINLISEGLKILTPVLRPDVPLAMKVSSDEEITYSALLIRSGSLDEAIEILEKVDGNQNPKSFLFQAHAHVAMWDYASALEFLSKYEAASQLAPYQLNLNMLNRASCMINIGKYFEAQEILFEVVKNCEEQNWILVWGNSLELLGQIAIFTNDFSTAIQRLHESAEKLERSGSQTAFFTKKWLVIAHLLMEGRSQLRLLENLQKEALHREHWETLRECDLFGALVTQDRNRFLRLYFGTPFVGYRKRILGFFPDYGQLPESFVWRFDDKAESINLFDLESCAIISELKVRKVCKPGQLTHRLLKALASDLYRPHNLGGLFARLFPGEYYNAFTSPHRVSMAISRCRALFKQERIPLKIQSYSGAYALEGHPSLAMKLSVAIYRPEEKENLASQFQIRKLRNLYGTLPFSSRNLSKDLKVSMRTANHIVKNALELNVLKKLGRGKSIKYKFL